MTARSCLGCRHRFPINDGEWACSLRFDTRDFVVNPEVDALSCDKYVALWNYDGCDDRHGVISIGPSQDGGERAT